MLVLLTVFVTERLKLSFSLYNLSVNNLVKVSVKLMRFLVFLLTDFKYAKTHYYISYYTYYQKSWYQPSLSIIDTPNTVVLISAPPTMSRVVVTFAMFLFRVSIPKAKKNKNIDKILIVTTVYKRKVESALGICLLLLPYEGNIILRTK
jgi:hypothetical protein